jgi:phosphopantetheinyl transferase (holo-ACP synthase)
VVNDENGNPKVEFLKVKFDQIKSIDISISHCREYAVATVTILIDE